MSCTKARVCRGFVEQSIRTNVERRLAQRERMTRGLLSRDEARRTGAYVSSGDVVKGLEKMLARAKSKTKTKPRW